jgi:molecular chaperone IbpA
MASGYSHSEYNKAPHWEPKDYWATPNTKTQVATVNFPSLFNDQFFLGFHDQIARWNALATMKKPASFPPYNIIKIDEDNYIVELAVAGYGKEDIDITVETDLLTVKSNKTSKTKEDFVHQGIAERSWEQQFVLGEWMSIKEAALKDGLLTIKVEREIPEELKPKTIKIK